MPYLCLFRAKLTEWLIGVVDAPKLPHKNIYKLLKENNLKLARKDQPYDKNAVLVIQDPMFTIFNPDLVVKTMKLIESCGKTPYLLPYIENGKAYHVKGF